MTDFKPGGFGAVLKRRREELALTLEDMAALTRIRKTYLQALEDENLGALPGSAYAIGFLRIYAQQLSLPVEPLLAALSGGGQDADNAGTTSGRPRRQQLPKGRGASKGRRPLYLFLLLAGVIAVYLFLRVSSPPSPPRPAPAMSPPPPPVVAPQQVLPQPPPVLSPGSPPPPPAPETEQAGAKNIELPVIPAEGAVVRMLPTVAGTMKVSLDRQELREYALLPDQSLYWKVTESLAVELSAPGLARIWVDQQELPVAEYTAFTLTGVRSQEPRP